MRKSYAAVLIAALATAAGCSGVHAEDGGSSVSRNYNVGNFQRIEVAGSYDVEVRTGANPGVSATGSEKLLENTIVEVQGDRLVIHPDKKSSWFRRSIRGHARFTVTVPQLSAASIAGSGDLRIDRIQGARFEGAIAGSGDLDLQNVDVQELKLSIAGSGAVKAGSGKARSAKYEIAGSGDVDAGGIQTQEASISVAGSGDVRAHASGTADVSIMGSGDVELSGGAKCSVSKAGSGDVRCS
ncbi:MAG TPA: head GIN domain-containing protein [Sphingomicrobium sp.]|jgi:hypothetical protein